MIKKIVLSLLIVFIGVIAYFATIYYPQLPIANGYAAKVMCSCTFIAERSQESIQNEDLGFSPLSLTSTNINQENKSVTTSIFGLVPRTAEYREGVGCVLINGEDDHQVTLSLDKPSISTTQAWPYGERVLTEKVEGVDYDKLSAAIEASFDASKNMDSVKTRAVVVVYKDFLIYESYANGFDKDTEILGWSMSKSITGTLIGMLAKEGKLSLTDKNLFPEWTDERSEITLTDLLQMQSGLSFSEQYDQISDATNMLYQSDNSASIPIIQPLSYPPGSYWSYSSGTTNLLMHLIQNKMADKQAYLEFPYKGLFDKLGMNSAVMEIDESGLYIGSSYTYATPRDWAKLGLLYLNQGNWNGEQIIDPSWVDFVRTPAENSGDKYGGQFWLNFDHSSQKDVPEDMYFAAGFQGQFVFVIPSYDLVVVRMGLSEMPIFNDNVFLSRILEAIDEI